MKKSLFMALAAGTFLFSACSSDDALNNDVAQDNSAQQIVLQVASSGDGLQTRAGRPLYSSAALQAINKVRVLVYNTTDKTIAYDSQNTIDWTKSLEYTTNGHGRRLTITLKGDDKLDDGAYKIVAIGYYDTDAIKTDYTFKMGENNVASATLKATTYSDITATLAAGKDAEEVFAGEADLTISDKNVSNKADGEIGAAVTLHRQVAGGFGYFTNIPAHIDGVEATSLRLVMRKKNDVLKFNNFNSTFTASGETGSVIKYAVNGSASASAPTSDAKFSDGSDAFVLYSINLKDWFPNGDKSGDGFLGKADYDVNADNWTRPSSIKASMLEGSVFAGKFIVPFKFTDGKVTMELQLMGKSAGASEEHIIKVWNVTIPDHNTDPSKGEVDRSNSIFNVVRNHMYNLGVKTTQDTKPEPGKPDPDPDPVTPPTPGPDQPEDLSKGQNLVLKVNDNWETIHQMEIE